MSQPPSLPTLTSFLRKGDMGGGRGGVGGDEGGARGTLPEKRRLQDGGAMHGRETLYEDEVLPPQQRQQKRRANLFLQYGEQEDYHQRQAMGVYDPRQQRASPHLVPTTHPLQRLPPPPAQHRQTMAFPDFAGNYDRDSIDRGRLVPPSAMAGVGRDGSHDARRAVPVKTQSPASTQQEPAFPRERTSRYLSEADRRSIILRIDNGEKQVALAKEYQVSRAAICNLYKNRKEVLTRSDKNPKAKHPKRLKDKLVDDMKAEGAASDATPPVDSPTEDKELSEDLQDDHMSDEQSSTDSNNDTEPARTSVSSPLPLSSPTQTVRVHNASAVSAPISRMVSILRNPQLPLATYRQVLKRLSTSLVEEVVALLPRHEVNVVTSSGYRCPSIVPLDDTKICGISIQPQGGLMLSAFTDIFPAASTGALAVLRTPDASNQSSVWRVEPQRLPPLHSYGFVLLSVDSCATGAKTCAALDHLISQGQVVPSSIYVVAIISSQSGLTRVHRQFPDVNIISGAIDEGVDAQGRIRPGIGNVMERLFC